MIKSPQPTNEKSGIQRGDTCLSRYVWGVIVKHHRWGSLSTIDIDFSPSGGRKSEMEVSAGLGQSPLLGLRLPLGPHGGRLHLNELITSQRPPLLMPSALGVRILT